MCAPSYSLTPIISQQAQYTTIPIQISNTLNIMPVATTQIRSERVAKPLKGTSSKSTTAESHAKAKPTRPLQQISPEETSKWLADLNDPSVRQYMFDSPEDPFEYPFKVGADHHGFFTLFLSAISLLAGCRPCLDTYSARQMDVRRGERPSHSHWKDTRCRYS